VTNSSRLRLSRGALLTLALLALPACQQQMAKQPVYRKYEPSEFFADGRSARPILAGTVHRDQPLDASPLVTGLTAEGRKARPAPPAGGSGPPEPPLPGAPDRRENYVDAFPFAITDADLHRGQERYTIFCAPCHGPLGNGRGKIKERGYLDPPSYVTDDSRGFGRFGVKVPLRDAPVGYFFEVMTRGYGGMPDYAAQVSPEDRWRIAAYVRALVLSQSAGENELREAIGALPPKEQQKTRDKLGVK
jgi:mono/diheme cytochrome c family protein